MKKNTTKKESAKAPKVKLAMTVDGAQAHTCAYLVFAGLPQKKLTQLGKVLGVPVAKYKAEMVNRLAEHVENKNVPVRVSIG